MESEPVYVPSGRGPELIAVYSFFIVLTTVVIAARCYVRVFMVRSFGSDDWAMLFGWAMFQCFAGFAIAGAFHGTGQHMDKIQPAWHVPIGLKVCRATLQSLSILHYTSHALYIFSRQSLPSNAQYDYN